MRRRILLFAAAGLAALVAAGLGLALVLGPAQEQEVRGLLVDVQSRNILHAESVTVRDASGGLHVFRVSPEVASDPEKPSSAAHLRQHLMGGIPVLVRYRLTSDGPVAIRILDAEGS